MDHERVERCERREVRPRPERLLVWYQHSNHSAVVCVGRPHTRFFPELKWYITGSYRRPHRAAQAHMDGFDAVDVRLRCAKPRSESETRVRLVGVLADELAAPYPS